MPRDGDLNPSPPARVLLLSAAHPPMDIRVVLKEGAALAAAGFDVTHLCPQPRQGFVPSEKAGVMLVTYPAASGWWQRLLAIPALARRAAAQQTDVIHASEPDAWVAALLARCQRGGRVVLDVHEHYPSRLDARLPDLLRPLSRTLLHIACALMGRAADAVVVAKDGLDGPFGGAARVVPIRNYAMGEVAPRRHGPGPITLLHLGAISRARGSEEMLHALALAPPETRLCLIGRFTDGSEAGFWAKARALGLADRIEAMGWLAHDAALAAAARCDIALILFQPGAENHRLALPHKLFDAMLAGLPVIAPMAATEVKAVVESAGCGVLVDVADPTAIAAAIQHLAQPARRAALGAAGQRAALARFAWAGEAARLVALYRRLLARDAAHLLRAR